MRLYQSRFLLKRVWQSMNFVSVLIILIKLEGNSDNTLCATHTKYNYQKRNVTVKDVESHLARH